MKKHSGARRQLRPRPSFGESIPVVVPRSCRANPVRCDAPEHIASGSAVTTTPDVNSTVKKPNKAGTSLRQGTSHQKRNLCGATAHPADDFHARREGAFVPFPFPKIRHRLPLVPGVGVEPTRLSSVDFEPTASFFPYSLFVNYFCIYFKSFFCVLFDASVKRGRPPPAARQIRRHPYPTPQRATEHALNGLRGASAPPPRRRHHQQQRPPFYGGRHVFISISISLLLLFAVKNVCRYLRWLTF